MCRSSQSHIHLTISRVPFLLNIYMLEFNESLVTWELRFLVKLGQSLVQKYNLLDLYGVETKKDWDRITCLV